MRSKFWLFLVVGGLSYEVRVSAMDEYQTGEEVVGRIELPDEGKLSLFPYTGNGVLSLVFE